MDGSSQVTLRNRQFLGKIQPLVPRYVSLDGVLGKHNNGNIKDVPNVELELEAPADGEHEQVVHRDGDDEGLRRSTRRSTPPNRYNSKW